MQGPYIGGIVRLTGSGESRDIDTKIHVMLRERPVQKVAKQLVGVWDNVDLFLPVCIRCEADDGNRIDELPCVDVAAAGSRGQGRHRSARGVASKFARTLTMATKACDHHSTY